MKKILIPCDFSDSSEHAMNYALDLASLLGSDLVLVHINQFPVASPEVGLSAYTYQDADKDSMDALNNLRLKIIMERNFTGEISCFTETGEFSQEMEKYTHEHQVDLIVMGISGHGNKLMKTLVGSSAVSVGKKAACPVLVIPPESTFKKPHTIAFACEYESEVQLEPGFLKVEEIAKALACQVNLVHVVPQDKQGGLPEHDSYFEHQHRSVINKTYLIHEKKATEAILNFLKDHDVDMVAVEPKKYTFFERLFHHSVSNDIVFYSPVPVLLVHP